MSLTMSVGVLIVLSLVTGFSFVVTSATDATVESYTIESVTNDSVTVTAEFEGIVPKSHFSIDSMKNTEVIIHPSEEYTDTLRYTIHIGSNGGDTAEFSNLRAVFVRHIFISDSTGRQLNAPIQLSETVSQNYEDIHQTESGAVLYKNETQVYSEIQDDFKVKVVVDAEKNIAPDVVDSVYMMSHRIADEDEHVTVYMVPYTNNGYSGYVFGTLDDSQYMWVSNGGVKYTSYDTVMHETVHVHQEYRTADDMRWINEGMAEYLEHLVVKQEYGESMFYMLNGNWYDESQTTDTQLTDVHLKDPSTWVQSAEYERGSRVMYLVDVALRSHSSGNRSVYDLLEWMNTQEETITYEDFYRYIVSNTDSDFGHQLDTYLGSHSYIEVSDEAEQITGTESYAVSKHTGTESAE